MSKLQEEIYKQKIHRLKSELEETKLKRNELIEKNQILEKSNSKLENITKKLQSNKEKFNAFTQNSPFAIIQIGVKGEILYANKISEEITGFSIEELTKKNIFDLLSPANTLFELRGIIGLEVNSKKSYEIKILNKKRKEIYIQIDAVKITTGESIAFFKDITDKKTFEQQNLLFKTLYENAPDGIFITDKKGKIVNCNKKFINQTCFKKEYIIGKNFTHFYEEKFNPIQTIKRIISKELKESEVNQKKADKNTILVWRKIIAFNDPDSNFTGNVAFTRDISNIQQGSNYLYKTAQEIELRNERIKKTNKELISLNEELTNTNKALNDSLVKNKQITKSLEESQSLYKLITENTGDYIITISFTVNPKIIYASPSHKKLGFNPDELIGKNPFDYIHLKDIAKLRKLLELYLLKKAQKLIKYKDKREDIKLNFRFRDKYNNWINAESIVSFMESVILFSSRDITEHIQNEKIIEKQNQEIKLANDRYKLLNNQLKKSEEEYRNIYDSSFDSIFIHEIETGKIIDVNKTAEKMFGYSHEEILLLKPSDLSIGKAPFDKLNALKKIQEAAKGEVPSFDWLAKTKNKNLFWTSITLKKTQIGGKERVMAVIRDINDVKLAQDELKNSEEIFKQLSDLSPTGIFIYQDNKFVYTNKSITTLLEYTKEELLNMDFWEAVHPEMREYVKEMGQKRQHGEKLKPRYEMKLITKSGKSKWVDFNATNIIYKNKPAGIGNVIDITKNKQYLTELNKAKEKAEEADKLKTTFLANMSHEIRTPMNGIIGFAQLLEEEDLSIEKRKEYLKIIDTSGQQLINIIDDILDISKIESGQLKIIIEKVSVNKIIEDVYLLFKNQFSESINFIDFIKAKSTSESDIYIKTDLLRVEQIFTNLINNSLKFTHKGYIEIGYEILDNFIRFYVKDSGIGIPKEKYSLVFSRFGQIEPEYTKVKGGTGIGLPISKGITELLGGEMYFESEENKGTTFFFTLPYKKETI